MNILKEITDLLALQNPEERGNKLEQLADIFEYGHDINKEEAIEGIKLLLLSAVQEQNEGTKESFFYAIETAVIHLDIGGPINWDVLANAIPSFNKKQLLSDALNILGLSGQEKYLSIMHTYAQDSDPEVREWAEEGIQEITYRLAHRDDAANKEE